ncbi:hypothetical protein [Pseudomonas veronii]
MINDIQFQDDVQSTKNTDAAPAKTTKGSPEIKGKKNLKKAQKYLHDEKLDDAGNDLHAGREFSRTNIPLDMLLPVKAKKLFPKKRDYNKYINSFSERKASFYYDHACESRNNNSRSKGKQFDAFKFIISCKPEELIPFKTDEEKADFLCELAAEHLRKMSGSKKINFYYDFVPHIKDGNPHVHVKMSTYTIDGQYFKFYRGKQDHGLIKMFDDIKYDLEEKYPHLLQMEHDKRNNNRLKVEVNKKTNEVTGEHAEIFNKLNKILESHAGANYSHPKIREELKEAGFDFRYSKAKSKHKFKDIQIFHKDAGDTFRSYANLPYQAKRVIENYETYQYYIRDLKIRTDVSATVSKATTLVNLFPSKNVSELNKVLYEELGAMLIPSFQKDKTTGRKHVSSWSFYLAKENIKFPALKAGVVDPKLFITTQDEAIALHETCEDMTYAATQQQKLKGNRYTQKNREEMPLFRFAPNESTEQFIARMFATRKYKQSLTSQMAMGNSVTSTYNNRKMLDTNGIDSLSVYQANRATAKSAMEWYVAQQFCEIEFKGVDNPAIQRLMYIEAVLHDVKITNYTPSPELKAEAQALLDAERDKFIKKNNAKILEHIKAVEADPQGTKQYLYLNTNRKLDVDVDQRPKLHSFLYGLKMGLEPSAFKHMDKLTLSKEEQNKVIEHFAKAEKVSDAQLAIILSKAGISFDEDPSSEERQKVPTASTHTSQPSAPAKAPASPAPVTRPATSTSPAGPTAPAKAKPPVSTPAKAGSDPNRKIKP